MIFRAVASSCDARNHAQKRKAGESFNLIRKFDRVVHVFEYERQSDAGHQSQNQTDQRAASDVRFVRKQWNIGFVDHRYIVGTDTAGIDLIRELRLRQWARTNYVPADMRSPSWHALVLDEMRRRDEELSESGALATRTRSVYVPLIPNELMELAVAS